MSADKSVMNEFTGDLGDADRRIRVLRNAFANLARKREELKPLATYVAAANEEYDQEEASLKGEAESVKNLMAEIARQARQRRKQAARKHREALRAAEKELRGKKKEIVQEERFAYEDLDEVESTLDELADVLNSEDDE